MLRLYKLCQCYKYPMKSFKPLQSVHDWGTAYCQNRQRHTSRSTRWWKQGMKGFSRSPWISSTSATCTYRHALHSKGASIVVTSILYLAHITLSQSLFCGDSPCEPPGSLVWPARLHCLCLRQGPVPEAMLAKHLGDGADDIAASTSHFETPVTASQQVMLHSASCNHLTEHVRA